MPVDTGITLLNEPIENLEILMPATITTEPLDAKSLPSYQVLSKQQELLSFQRQATIAEGYPTLSLGANYTYNTQSDQFNLYTKNALNYDVSAVNLTLRIPLFDGFSRKARTRQTEFQILKGQEELSKTNNRLQMNYNNAKNQIANSLEAINAQKANKELAEEVFLSASNNYKNGLASLTDLLDAESGLVTAQNSYNESLLNFKIAEIELIKSKGDIKSLLDQ